MNNTNITELTLNWILNFGEKFLGKILVCIISLGVAMVLIKVSKTLTKKMIADNPKFTSRKSMTISTVVESICRYVIYFFLFCQILTAFGINVNSIIAVAGVGSVAIGFGAQSLVQDVVTGMFILIEDQFGVGDYIDIGGLSGTVVNISLRTTTLRATSGDMHIIPNGQVKAVTNMSKEFNRGIVDIPVNYEYDIKKVIGIMEDELKEIYENKRVSGLAALPQVLGIESIDNGVMTIRICADTQVGENWTVERNIRFFIKQRLDKENIISPYPHTIIENKE